LAFTLLYSRKFNFGYNRTNKGNTVPKRLHTLATEIAMIAVDNNRY